MKVLEAAALNGDDFSPPHYPFAVPDLMEAFNMSSVKGLSVLVSGAVSPWVESLLLANGASQITTCDFSTVDVQDPRLKFVHVSNLLNYSGEYDAVVSFSSIEHDGLGRYGDPIDPLGDFAAMKEINFVLKPHGILFLGIPVCGGLFKKGVPDPMKGSLCPGGLIAGNAHRIYGKRRFDALLNQSNFIQLAHVKEHHTWGGKMYWQNQPVFILQKVAEVRQS